MPMFGGVEVGKEYYELTALEAAALVCGRKGFVLDAEPMVGDVWRVTAKRGDVTISKTGLLTEAVSRLIESIQ